jgi:hypothetical protein
MWRDEVQPLMIALDATSFSSFLYLSSREGHPLLWYLLVKSATYISPSPFTLKIINFFFISGSFLLLYLSPLKKYEKLLVATSFYFLFEYFVISRGYSLVIFFSFLYLFFHNRERYFSSWLTLGFLSNSEVFGALLSIFFVIFQSQKQGKKFKNSYWGAAVFLVMFVFSIFTMLQSSRLEPTSSSIHLLSNLYRVIKLWAEMVIPLHPNLLGWLYSPDLQQLPRYWAGKPNWEPLRFWHIVILSILMFLVYQDRKNLTLKDLFILGAPFLLISCFMFVYPTAQSQRHLGMIFLGLITSLWIIRGNGNHANFRFYISLLLMSSLCNLVTIGFEGRKFSYGEDTAMYITKKFKHYDVVGFPSYSFQVISAHMQKPLYFLECRCSARTFLTMDQHYKIENIHELSEGLSDMINNQKIQNPILILNFKLSSADLQYLKQSNFKIKFDTQFIGGEVWDEDAYIYILEKQANL